MYNVIVNYFIISRFFCIFNNYKYELFAKLSKGSVAYLHLGTFVVQFGVYLIFPIPKTKMLICYFGNI